ncbi:c-type cytochrome [Comamonas flocculans]|uniref:Cytochrome c n=1 Tax=Comamonas flocculans TaxID=2597701 RepID=A0A5B8RS62_9BURK|nr:cytochrome c [Comamonas flocculans]QEA11648.1 cytochrome c [Comamonas flocculans]
MPNSNERPEAQQRESTDPEERIRPMPLLPALIAIGMVLFGIIYIAISGPYSRPWMGDERTLADLQAKPAGGGGADAAVDGGAIYAANCASCHQASGAGLPGVFPPLDGSEWVHGSPKILANIVLHGIDGEITVKGNTYKGLMPSFAQLSDAELAGVLTHIRSSWSNQNEPVDAELLAQERKSGRDTPFESGEALKALEP